MGLDRLVYSPLLEEDPSVAGWDKSTIEYIQNNKEDVIKEIRRVGKRMYKNNLQPDDINDIYSEILLYLYKCDDYSINKAISRSSSGNIVSLEGYTNTCIKFCVIRYLTNAYKIDKEIVRDSIDKDGKELSAFDIIPDRKSTELFDTILFDLKQHCKASEHMRYKYGPDIYMIWYVRLLTMVNGNNDTYKDILILLGVSKKELSKLEKSSAEDEIMIHFAKSISNSGLEVAISIIEEYVYSAARIKDVVLAYR